MIVLGGLTETQRRQLVLADNRIALNAGWDVEMLCLELKDLSAIGANLAALGFSQDELKKALALPPTAGLVDEDETPGLEEVAVSQPGDLWCLGQHRLICGDSTNPDVVRRVMADAVPDRHRF